MGTQCRKIYKLRVYWDDPIIGREHEEMCYQNEVLAEEAEKVSLEKLKSLNPFSSITPVQFICGSAQEHGLTDERVSEIRRAYYEAKKILGDMTHSLAVLYYSKTKSCIALIEKPLASLLAWALSEFETIEEQHPREMVARPITMHVILESLLGDMVSYGFLEKDKADELVRKSRLATVGTEEPVADDAGGNHGG